jgi:hypothetical protein
MNSRIAKKILTCVSPLFTDKEKVSQAKKVLLLKGEGYFLENLGAGGLSGDLSDKIFLVHSKHRKPMKNKRK